MNITQAILELCWLQAALLRASDAFVSADDPPYQWSQRGTVTTGGTKWTYTKPYAQGYRFETDKHVVVEILDVLACDPDSITATHLAAHLASKNVQSVVLEDASVAVAAADIDRLLARLATTGLLARADGAHVLQRHADLAKAVTLAQDMAHDYAGTRLGAIAIEAVIRELLWGPREMWRSVIHGRITRDEAASILLADLTSRLLPAGEPLDWGGSPLAFELARLFPS